MSHIVKQTSSVQIKNLDLLKTAVEALGGTLVQGQKTATFYAGKKHKCDHAIKFPGTEYEIAVVAQPDGTFQLEADLYCKELRKLVSSSDPNTVSYSNAKTDKIFERYKVANLNQIARQKGYRARTEQRLPDGRIKLTYIVP